MQLHRVVADVELAGDRLVALAAGEKLQDLLFARGELGRLVLGRLGPGALQDAGELHQHRRCDHHLSLGDAAYRVDDGLGIHVLQQIAAGAGAQRVRHVVLRIAHGQDRHRHLAAGLAQPPQERDAVHRRHAQVHHDQVGGERAGERERLVGVAGGGQHGDVALQLEKLLQAAAAQAVVVDEQDLDRFGHEASVLGVAAGMQSWMRVPCPAALWNSMRPPSRLTRSRMMLRP